MITQSDRVLLVVAHPDDDVLGFGAVAFKLASAGIHVQACILSGDVGARRHRPSDSDLRADMLGATRILGMAEPIVGNFPNIRMNTVDHLELVRFVEGSIRAVGSNIVLTSHPSDLNDDHRQVSRAAQAAARLQQRGGDVPPLKMFGYMEILSSTDWGFAGEATPFSPNVFFPVTDDDVRAKIEALDSYRGVMRPYPHPRSEEAITALATIRGAQSGVGLAEAVQVSHLAMTVSDGKP